MENRRMDRGLELYDKALKKVNEIYISGALKYIEEHDKELNDKIDSYSLNGKIDSSFKDYVNGKIELFDLRKILGEWYFLIEEACKRYNKVKNL